MMRYKRSTILILFFIFLSVPNVGQASVDVSANNAVLIEQHSGRVLFEKDAHKKETIASITKIMTAIIAIESGQMDEHTKVSRRSIYQEGSSIYLEQGEKMKVKDLVYGLMLRSGNDAANAIAEHIGGSSEGFTYLMNEKAKWIGMTNTNFDNPHGLDDEEHYSTAYDMALLLRYAMENKIFQKVSGTHFYQADNRSYSWKNKNKLLDLYPYSVGGKTGFTKKAGRTLVSAAKKDNMSLISVTLNAPDDWNDHIHMYEWGFSEYEMETLLKEGSYFYEQSNTNEWTEGFHYQDVLYPLTHKEVDEVVKKSNLSSINDDNRNTIGETNFYLDGTYIVGSTIHSSKENDSNRFFSNIIYSFKSILRIDDGLW